MKEAKILIAILLLVVGLCSLTHIPMETRWYSAFMVFHFICVLLLIWSHRQLTPFFLFMCTFIFLFIGGRFWVTLVDPTFDRLMRGNFFCGKGFSIEEWIITLRYILMFLYTATIGYLLIDRGKQDLSTNERDLLRDYQNPIFSKFLNLFIMIVAIIVVSNIVPKLILAIESGQYVSLYLNSQNKPTQFGGGIWYAFMWFVFGITMVYGSYKQRLSILIIIALRMIILAYIGQRGGLGCFILFCIWYYYKDKQIRLLPLAIISVIGIALVWIGSYLSMRGDVAMLHGENVVHRFFFSEGVSLTVFLDSMRVTNYPIYAYWSDFLPGVGSLLAKFSSQPIYNYDYNFTHFLSYSLNPELYHNGWGLGWTLLSDLYVFSKGKMLLFALLSLLFGIICGAIERGGQYSTTCRIIVYACFINFVFLPRAGLESIIPLIVWMMFMFGAVAILFNLPIKLKKLKQTAQ